MSIKDKLVAKDKKIQKTINLDENLYERIQGLSKNKYNESISRIINVCVYELAETEDVKIYNGENENLIKHTIYFEQKH